MASTPPGARKQKIDFTVDQGVYAAFMKKCSNMGMAPQVVIERCMKKYSETGQI